MSYITWRDLPSLWSQHNNAEIWFNVGHEWNQRKSKQIFFLFSEDERLLMSPKALRLLVSNLSCNLSVGIRNKLFYHMKLIYKVVFSKGMYWIKANVSMLIQHADSRNTFTTWWPQRVDLSSSFMADSSPDLWSVISLFHWDKEPAPGPRNWVPGWPQSRAESLLHQGLEVGLTW